MKKIFIILIAIATNFFYYPTSALAQDARVSQSYANPLRLNPAIMGANNDLKFIVNYRSQWASIDKGYTTVSLTGLYPIFFEKSTNKLDIGLSVMSDKAGAFKTFDAAIAADYNKELAPNNNLCLSLIGGFVQKSFDAANQSFDDQYVLGSYSATNSTNELTLKNKVSHADLGFGFMWYLNPSREKSKLNAYVGLAGFHLNRPNQTLIGGDGKLPMRFSYQGGIKFLGDNKIDISPNVRIFMQNGNIESAAGVYVDYNFNAKAKLVIGSWYRTHDAFSVLLGFEHKNYVIGYSYDIVNSDLNKVTTGVNAHEITLSYKLNRKAKTKAASIDDNSNNKSNANDFNSPFSSF
ncbi:MAG TPA: PorP/SprF family type IX secretion system membrane protein [Bacteroidia bacterium]|jgi:type IX secretion system PorP/SprF family membrane protein